MRLPSSPVSGSRVRKWTAPAAVILSLSVLAACTSTKSGVTTVYYNVPGTTVEEINQQIAIRGPQDGHAIGTTETRMTPKVRTVRRDGKCKIDSVDVLLELKVTLPRWAELDKADRQTRAGFAGLGRHVEEHEQVHVEISQEYAEKIEKTLLAMPANKSCRVLINNARTKFKDLFQEHNQAQRAFDARERSAIERRLRALGYS
ncbi:MAG: DUF922 domain-containing Zn-dependent protease [Alphaproteobacteria bacterium]|nr:DUF922 domain-containing Zn-dependent protease [Alphaproteobacteria bacterium]